jgi:hypothetical protein
VPLPAFTLQTTAVTFPTPPNLIQGTPPGATVTTDFYFSVIGQYPAAWAAANGLTFGTVLD